MKQPFSKLTLSDVEQLRKNRSCIPPGLNSIVYNHTMLEILSAQAHLKSLYRGGVTLLFTERILLLNDIY